VADHSPLAGRTGLPERIEFIPNVGQFVFTTELFDVIEAVDRALPSGAELDDVPVLQRMLAGGRLVGRRMRGRFLDLGLPEGFAQADRVLRSGA
jgi:UTP-glucose-1-phosphate uridylyltransferase